jgi:hypothetical protein
VSHLDGADEAGAFIECPRLLTMSFPPVLREIGDNVFRLGKTLQSLDLSGTLITSISTQCFLDCKRLESIVLPGSLLSVGDAAFSRCYQLAAMDLSHTKVRTIGAEAFYGCRSMASALLPGSLEEIGAWAFAGCKRLASIDLAGSAWTLGVSRGAFVRSAERGRGVGKASGEEY